MTNAEKLAEVLKATFPNLVDLDRATENAFEIFCACENTAKHKCGSLCEMCRIKEFVSKEYKA